MKEKNIIILSALIAMSIFFVYFATADYEISFSNGQQNITVNEDSSDLINITINNNYTDINSNITTVNITFDSNITIVSGTNGSNLGIYSTNTSNTITWENLSGLVINVTNNSFWFNTSVTTPGTYNITVSITNVTGITDYNITLFVTNLTANISNINDTFNRTTNSISINWSSNEQTNATIYYYYLNSSGNYTTNATSTVSGLAKTQSITIVGLNASTTYYYYIQYCDSSYSCNLTSLRSFTTKNYVVSTSFNFLDSVNSSRYNITINNSNPSSLGNLTKINVTLPSSFTFILDTNISSESNTFSNYTNGSKYLIFENTEGFFASSTYANISFALNNTTPGTYNITVSITDSYNSISMANITVVINDTTAPSIDNIAHSNPTETKATITWDTDDLANSTVCYGTSANPCSGGESKSDSSNTTTGHSVQLTDLEPVTKYFYEVRSCNAYGLCFTSTDGSSFTTDSSETTSSGGGSTTTTSSSSIKSYSGDELEDLGNINTTLADDARARIKIEGDRYYIGIVSISSSSVTINITDKDHKLLYKDKFNVGDSKKYEVTDDNYYDLEIKLNKIKNSEANLTITFLHSLVSQDGAVRPNFNLTEEELLLNSTGNETEGGLTSGVLDNPVKLAIFIIVAIVILLIIGLIINKVGSMKKGGNEDTSVIGKVKHNITHKAAKHDAKNRVKVKSP